MKTAIYTLYQKTELGRATFLVNRCVPSLNVNRQLLLFVNDDGLDALVEICRALSPFIHVLGGNGNLGVAGGRNAVIKHGVAAGFDFFISCDNDVIFADGYFESIEAEYRSLKQVDPKVGLMQPILLDGRQIKGLLGIDDVVDWQAFGNGSRLQTHVLDDIWGELVTAWGRDKAASTIYHAGISNPWLSHFQGLVSASTAEAPWDEGHETRFRTKLPTLRHDLQLLATLVDAGQPVNVFTVAGGITAFHRDVVDAVGVYNEKFNPFGYEDSELGFRATRIGLNNYVLCGVLAIHDPFMGARSRSLISHATIARLRAIEIADLKADDPNRGFALAQAIFFCWASHSNQFKDAVTNGELEHGEVESASRGFFASYVLNFLYGLFGNVRANDGEPGEHLFDHLLPSGFSGYSASDVKLDLGRNGRFRASDVDIRHVVGKAGRRILSVAAMNCRLEEGLPESAALTSRYVDIYLSLAETGTHRFEFKINLQADSRTYAARYDVDVTQAMSTNLRSPPQVTALESKHNTYDVGSFSTETIYPAPTFARSARWLPAIRKLAQITNAEDGAFSWLVDPVANWLAEGPKRSKHPATPAATASRRKRILIFTDSRGQHKPIGQNHPMFAERLKADPSIDVELYLCPMKWTTTLDFLAMFDREKLSTYDAIILWTGIVDWSPRPVSSAKADLYDNHNVANLNNVSLNTRDYSSKVVNNKKEIFDHIFGEAAIREYFASPFGTTYAGEKTSNMYSLTMAEKDLLPRLADIPNLVFINSNRFVPNWEGDFKKGRPQNIAITHKYSDLFTQYLAKTAKVIDLRTWSNEDVKRYTCDNLHVTEAGNNYIYGELVSTLRTMNVLTGPDLSSAGAPLGSMVTRARSTSFTGITNPERIIGAKQTEVLDSVRAEKYLATLVVGVRLKPGDKIRLRNFMFMLKWLEYHYAGLFDILIVEQDSTPRLNLASLGLAPHVRYKFIYNPSDFNRGWGYNVAVKHFCLDARIVVLMDADILTGGNFVREVMDCHTKYDAISPYQNIYYSTPSETLSVCRDMRIDVLSDSSRIKNPITVAGGLLIIRRDVFLSLKGFEQYCGYGCEDRAMDVTLFNHVPESKLRVAPVSYVHLHHTRDLDGRGRFDDIYAHLVTHYRCTYQNGLGAFDFIHKGCSHAPMLETLALMRQRADSFGDIDLYRSGSCLTVNGQRSRGGRASRQNVIYPPDFNSLREYKEHETYKSAPEPDSTELATFYNAYKGKRCFIIGNGPSLNKHDLSLLDGEYTFGVNSFFYKTRETGFTPYFYVVEDSSVMKENIEEIRAYNAPFKFFPTIYKHLHPKRPNVFFFNMNRGFYEKSSPNFVVPRFSTDASDVLYCGQSVTYINLQLAYFMGFEEIYLIGMDFNYVIPASHSRTGDVLLSNTDDPNHFHKDYFGKGKTWKDPKLDRVALNYKMAKLVYESTGRSISNATIGGHLEVFGRVDYASLFPPRLEEPKLHHGRITFGDANRLFRGGDYSGALSAYVDLARQGTGFPLYQRSALESYRRAKEAKQPCSPNDVVYVRNLMAAR